MRSQTMVCFLSRATLSITFSLTFSFSTVLSLGVSFTPHSSNCNTALLPCFLMARAPVWSLKVANPAQSPSFIFEMSIFTTPLHVGPSIRCVSVLGARKMLGTTRLVFSLSHPARSVRLQALSTGLWFHCQCSPSLGAVVKSSLHTMWRSGSPLFKGRITVGTRPSSSPSIGQPSIQRQGLSVSTRPTPPRSWNITPYQSPYSESTIVP